MHLRVGLQVKLAFHAATLMNKVVSSVATAAGRGLQLVQPVLCKTLGVSNTAAAPFSPVSLRLLVPAPLLLPGSQLQMLTACQLLTAEPAAAAALQC